jgi:hypothetical protein
VRRNGAVSWSSSEDVRKRAGPCALGAGLLSLCPMPKRILPARSRSAAGIVSLTPGVRRMTGSTAALASFAESSALLHELAGVEVSPNRWNAPPKRWVPTSPTMNAGAWKRWAKWRLPCMWEWTVRECRCVPRKSLRARASSRMVPPKPARPRWSPCGPPNPETRRAPRAGSGIGHLFGRD